MYFKQLEMQGFKSFVDPTTLNFESGITAIVGPNGCGKSNIVDSIRWVLGEQSAKSLRGARMEDVIFNGTDQRKAVGMAEVSLTMNNSDRQLKSQHEEITITRRTFRSGESEYLINKVPCRLRDIQDLFMDTGIGTNSYSILEQGKIDLIVSSKPADRRFVFEEAAGISKYKARKDESLRKLESTEQNYLRVNDIAVEVKRQTNSLERQVQKARRFQSCKQELTTLEVSRGKRELKEKRRQLRKIEQEWEGCQTRTEEQEVRRLTLEAEISGLNDALTNAEAKLTEMQESVHRVNEEMIKTEDFVSSSELRKNDLQISIERLETELTTLNTKETQLREQNAGTLEAREQKENELLSCQESLSQEEERLNVLEQELKERAARVQDQQSRLLEIVDQMSTLRGTLKNLGIRRGEQEQRLAKLELQLESLHEQNQEMLREKNILETDAKNNAESIAALRAEQEKLTQEKERLEHVLKTLTSMLENFNTTLTQLTSRLTWIEELKNGLDGYETGAKTILLEKKSKPERFPGIIGPVLNFIRTDEKYEFAFEALLGHRLQYILLQKESDTKPVIEFLQAGNRGRATFIPLENYLHSEIETLPGEAQSEPWLKLPGTLGWAKYLVRIDERFRGIFNQLLDDVVIVQDMEAMQKAREAGAQVTLVTLNGEIQTRERWLTGGSQDVMEKGLLGREREIEELKAELEVLQKNLVNTQAEMDTTKLCLEETTGGLETVNSQLHEMEIKAAQIEKSLEGTQTQLQEVEKQTVVLQGERAQVIELLNKTLSEHAETAKQLMELELTDRKTQEELTNHQEEIEERRREYDERSLRAGELRVSSASLEQQLSNLNTETGRVTTELNEISAQKAEKITNIKRDQDRMSDMDYQMKEKQAQLERLSGNKVIQEKALSGMKQQRETLTAQKKEKEAGLREIQDILNTTKQELHEFELKKTQLKMNLKSLETYMEEEYKLNLNLENDEEGSEETAVETSEDTEAIRTRIKELKDKINTMGSVNLVAMEEYDELEQRYEFLTKQLSDLKEAKDNLQRLITKINLESRERFSDTFSQVRIKFKEVFRRLFNGGDADLVLLDETNMLETGIEIIARPPGKRLQNISLLSGGEKALTAIALLFAIFLIKPSPFCIFDEMDAPLDDTNTMRFGRILNEFAKKSQFIVITHNKITMETAGVLYGVTMQESGVSSLIAVKFKGDKEEQSLQPVTSMAMEEVSLN
ncbi:chromosome segregation protein SMC [bacterium]|nr:chromosome segregation protein SMC [bacterium]